MPGIDDYSDIISLPHPEIPYHPRMSIRKRAAQFAPFAALTGFEETLDGAAQSHLDAIPSPYSPPEY
jgi:hypothetical protein